MDRGGLGKVVDSAVSAVAALSGEIDFASVDSGNPNVAILRNRHAIRLLIGPPLIREAEGFRGQTRGRIQLDQEGCVGMCSNT